MDSVLIVREVLEKFYTDNDYWLVPLAKAGTAFLAFFFINRDLQAEASFGSPFVLLGAAALCAFLPWSAITAFGAVFILGNLYELSIGLAAATTVIFIIAGLAQSAFHGGYSILICLVPVCFHLHIPYLVPIIAGLKLSLMSSIPVAIGVIIYRYLMYLSENLSIFSSGTTDDMTVLLSQYAGLFTGFFKNKAMLLEAIAFVIGLIVVYIIRTLDINFAGFIGTLVGFISMVIVLTAGAYRTGSDFTILSEIIPLLLSLLLSIIFAFLRYGADYQRTERVRFEDDDYFYFVKAVPKLRARKD